MDSTIFLDWGNYLIRLRIEPHFEIADYILMCLMVKEDILQQASLQFTRKHPFSSWLCSMLMCFSGTIISNLLLGDSPIAPFKNVESLVFATITWYLIFYSPFDIVNKIVKLWPFRIAVCVMKEIYRAKKVYVGVAHAAKLYPQAYIIIAMIGTVKGAGYTIMRVFERLIRGVWIPSGHELLTPSFGEVPAWWDVHSATKGCLLASVTYLLELRGILPYPHALVHLAVTAFFIYFKLMALFFNVLDPFIPFENLFCTLFLGGMSDAWNKLRSPKALDDKPARPYGSENSHDDKKRD